MTFFTAIAALAAGTLFTLSAQAQTADLYGRTDAIWDAKLSPDAKRIALGCGAGGKMSVCVYDLATGKGPEIFHPGEEPRLLNFYWASDTHIVTNVSVFTSMPTARGMRDFDVRRAVAFNVDTGKSAMLMRNESGWLDSTSVTSLCDRKPGNIIMDVVYRPDDAPKTGQRAVASKQGLRTQLFEVNLDSGRAKRVPQRLSSVAQIVYDNDCNPLLHVVFNDERQQYSLDLAETRKSIFELENAVVEPLDVIGLNAARDGIIVRADYPGAYGLQTIPLAGGPPVPLTLKGNALGNLAGLTDPLTGEVFGFSGTADLVEHIYTDERVAAVQKVGEAAFGGKIIRVISFSRDRAFYTLAVESKGEPVSFYLYDAALNELSPLGSLAPQLDTHPRAQVISTSFKSRDGLDIPTYVVLPSGKPRSDGPFKTVLLPHGGPESRDTAEFDWWAHAYADAGYAVVRPNFRGSSGYGADFRNAGFGEFGGKMIDDVVDAISWAETSGLSRREGVCIAGASYGGYAALMTGLRAPDKVKCVVAIAPVTNIFAHMARYDSDSSTYNYWKRYAGSTEFSDQGIRASISPELRAAEFRMPVLLMHGSEDLVVSPLQSLSFRSKWGERPGLTFVSLEQQDHYLTSSASRKKVLTDSLAFLATHHPAR